VYQEDNMNILRLITGHEHYWGIPHQHVAAKFLIQTCYECGADRKVKADLQPSPTPEPNLLTITSSSQNDDRKAA